MRETPGQEHLEAWCLEMTFGGTFLNSPPDELLERAKIEDRDARRLLRVADKTPATKGPKRRNRFRKASHAKTRAVYLVQLAAAVRSCEHEEVGDLSYAAAHMVLANARAFGEAWLRRQVFV